MQNNSAERKLLKVFTFRKNNTGGGLGVIFAYPTNKIGVQWSSIKWDSSKREQKDVIPA
jgi:hypothetical protein